MKQFKLIIIFITFNLSLCFASQSDLTLQNNKLYNEAFNYYQNQNYQKSFDAFHNLVEQYPANEKVNFYYASSAFELEKYQIAFIIYDRILINNPLNHRARLEYARTLLMLKQYDKSKEEFNKVLSSPIPVNVRKNIEKFLSVIEKQQKTYNISNLALFGFGWDSNIDNATYAYNNNLINGLINSNTDAKKDYHFKNILLNNLILPFKNNNRFAFENTIVSYLQKQKKYDENDIYLLSLAGGVSYMNNNLKNSSKILLDNIWVGGSYSFYTYGLSNSLTFLIDQQQLLTLNAIYKKKKYKTNFDKDKNSNNITLDLTYSLILDKQNKFTLSNNIEVIRKESGTRTDISKNDYGIKLGYERDFLNGYKASAAHQFKKSQYEIASGTLPKREDKQHYTTLKLTKELSKSKNINLELSSTNNNSNNNIYSYKKNQININYTILF